MAELQSGMPPGWDCKLDEKTGKYYFINHYTRTTTWEDPRNRHRPFQGTPKHLSSIQNECIPLQHGSPDLRRNYVYPSHTSPIPAFQIPAHNKSIPFQDMKPRMSPLSVRSPKVQDSSLSLLTDTDEAVAKIAAMFPTVSETHIRILLKKYHSREALVISALQVEKHPITTPGPFATPPPQRNIHHPLHATPPLGLHHSSRGGSPIVRPGSGSNSTYTGSPRVGDGYRSSPRPHSSPKLKLRYMKSVFPHADETVILDILQNNENNIQKTSDALKEMGYSKKDTVRVAQEKLEAQRDEKIQEELKQQELPSPPPKLDTIEDKETLKKELQEKYKDVAEHLIVIALESVHFDKNRANQILQIMIQEDNQVEEYKQIKEVQINSDVLDAPSTSKAVDIPVSQSRQSLKSLLKAEKEIERVSYSRIIEEKDNIYRSPYLSNTKGRNPDYAKGPSEKLLLEDYVRWQGNNSNLRKGPQGITNGSNKSLLSNRSYQVCGPNKDIRQGPIFGLSKGSIFCQIKTVVVGESCGE